MQIKSKNTLFIILGVIVLFLISLLLLLRKEAPQKQSSIDLEVKQITLSEVEKASEEVLSPDGKNSAFIISGNKPGIGVIYRESGEIKAFYPDTLSWRYFIDLSWESNSVVTFVLKVSPYHEVLYKLDVISEKILLWSPQQPIDK